MRLCVFRIQAEMDMADAHLIGEHSFCTMELVNLLLVGRAVSNQFDGNKTVDGMTLRGISDRPDVGVSDQASFPTGLCNLKPNPHRWVNRYCP